MMEGESQYQRTIERRKDAEMRMDYEVDG